MGLRFDRFELLPSERKLLDAGHPVALGARAFDLLLALIERRHRLVSKAELLDLVWPGLVVEEANLPVQVSGLRKIIGSQAIATVPGLGYRFSMKIDDEPAAQPADAQLAVQAAPRTNVPAAIDVLLGRETDIDTLGQWLSEHRLVTVLGAGGIGKTRLAQAVARAAVGRHRDGIWWVDVAALASAENIVPGIASAAQLQLGEGDALAQLVRSLGKRELLLVLDNCEHLAGPLARIVRALLGGAAGVRVLCTSQEALRVEGEHLYMLSALAVPPQGVSLATARRFAAVQLLEHRARAADARFSLTEANVGCAIDLCRQLDGLPLAIELAAVRAPVLGLQRLAALMQDRLRLLTRNHDSQAPARQQTLRAALEWSIGFLDVRERTVFRRLGVMADSASLAFIQEVAADESGELDAWCVLEALSTLADRSLVCVAPADQDAPRYRLLESPRALALEHLDAARERAALQRRHARALAAAFDAAWDERWSGNIGLERWAFRIRRDASHARAAIEWARAAAEPETAVTIATTLSMASSPWSVEHSGLGGLCASLVEQIKTPQLRLRALLVAAFGPVFHASQKTSLALASEALALARSLFERTGERWPVYQALCEWIVAAASGSAPQLDALHAAIAELDTLEDPRWPPHRLQRGCWARSLPHVHSGNHAQVLVLTRRWLTLTEAAGADPVHCMGALVDAELACGHVDAAIDIGEKALNRLVATNDDFAMLLVNTNLAGALLAVDATHRARALLQQAWPIASRLGMHYFPLASLTLLAALENRPRAALCLATYADCIMSAQGKCWAPPDAQTRERSLALALAALEEAARTRSIDEGRSLREEQVAALAFATVDIS